MGDREVTVDNFGHANDWFRMRREIPREGRTVK